MERTDFFFVEELAADDGGRVLVYRAPAPGDAVRRGVGRVWGFSGSGRTAPVPDGVVVTSLKAGGSTEMLRAPIEASDLVRRTPHDARSNPPLVAPNEARLLVSVPDGLDPSTLWFELLYERIKGGIDRSVLG